MKGDRTHSKTQMRSNLQSALAEFESMLIGWDDQMVGHVVVHCSVLLVRSCTDVVQCPLMACWYAVCSSKVKLASLQQSPGLHEYNDDGCDTGVTEAETAAQDSKISMPSPTDSRTAAPTM